MAVALHCPKCSNPLVPRPAGKVVVDHCPGCGGIWFDEDELQKGLASGGREDLKRLSLVAPANQELDSRPANCPKANCSNPLVRAPVPGNASIYVDFCSECGGVWYDGGEVAELLADGMGTRIGRFLKSLVGG